MPALGLLLIVAGAFFYNAAFRNISPTQSLESVLKNPGGAKGTLSGTGNAFDTSGDTVFVNVDSATSAAASPSTSGGTGAGAVAIAYARQQIGKPYKFGATGPNAYDCSGLVQSSFKAAGVSLPRTSALMAVIGTAVSKNQLAPGDLVFPDAGHVQIYTGGGMVIEAPHTGAFVREVSMWGFWTARRVGKIIPDVNA